MVKYREEIRETLERVASEHLGWKATWGGIYCGSKACTDLPEMDGPGYLEHLVDMQADAMLGLLYLDRPADPAEPPGRPRMGD